MSKLGLGLNFFPFRSRLTTCFGLLVVFIVAGQIILHGSNLIRNLSHAGGSRKRWKRLQITVAFGAPGLGNNLFQYAALFGLARYSGRLAVGPSTIPEFDGYFNLSAKVDEHIETTTASWGRAQELRSCAFDPVLADTARRSTDDLVVFGYFQSWRYFQTFEKDLRREFQFSSEITREVKDIYRDWNILHHYKGPIRRAHRTRPVKAKTTIIGIHVRRGDFLEKRFIRYGYTTADKAYIQRAMDYFEDKYRDVVFIVCSNGVQWCRKNIDSKHGRRQVHVSTNRSAILDMALLASCDHVITTTGTFSWWAGWLAGGEVVYYQNFPGKDTPLEEQFPRPVSEYYLPDWIGM